MDTLAENKAALGLDWNEKVTELQIYTHGRLSVVPESNNLAIAHGFSGPLPHMKVALTFVNLWTFERYGSYMINADFKDNVLPASFPVNIAEGPGVAVLGSWGSNHLLFETDFDVETNKFGDSSEIKGSKTNVQPNVANLGAQLLRVDVA